MVEILENRSLIHLYGSDAEKFLQGQTTNDIIKKQYSYNFVLNNQGRYLFDFFVYRENGDSFYLDIHSNSAEELIKRLSMYKLRSDVELKDVSDELCALYSKEAIEDSIFSFGDPRSGLLAFRSVMERSKITDAQKYLRGLYLQDKYDHSIIDGVPDLIYEKSIPIEYGADELNAIDYQKGCYVGQEVISRAKYQGVIRKKIYKLRFGAEIATNCTGAMILDSGGNKIGAVCSSYGNLAIALLREEKYLGLNKKMAMVHETPVDILIPEWRNTRELI